MIRSRGGTKYPYAWAVTVTGRDDGTWGRPWERSRRTASRDQTHPPARSWGGGRGGNVRSETPARPGVTIGGEGGQCGQFAAWNAASVAQICHYIIY